MTPNHTIHELARQILTPKQLQAWELWEIHGLGYTRIADRLGISTSSARDRIHRSIRALEPHIEQDAA